MRPETSVVTAAGARRAEDRVVAEALGAARAIAAGRPPLRPVLVVVPSQSLRLHLVGRLLAGSPAGAVVGAECVTHFALALRILDRIGAAAPRGLDLFAVLARRFARREPVLVESLEALREGYSGVLGAVRDLLDAGLQAGHLEAVEEALEVEGPQVASPQQIERAQALARVTVRTLTAFEELQIGRSSTLLQAATEGVRSQPEVALAADRVVLHGFADATGVTADFLQALLRAYGGVAVIDRPPDPVAPTAADASSTFTDRLVERLAAVAAPGRDDAPAPVPRIELFRALGQEAEVREVAHRCLDLLAAGTAPESIGIVMRDPLPYSSLLRGTLGDYGVPFSGLGLTGPATPAGRRLRALAELVAQGSRSHVERWLDALTAPSGGAAPYDLRIALAALGVARIEELAALDIEPYLDGGSYALPVREGFYEAEEEGDGHHVVRTRRRHVSGDALRTAVAAARRLRDLFSGWTGTACPLAEHRERLDELAALLGWRPDAAHAAALSRLGDAIAGAPPIVVDHEEFALLLRRLAAEAERVQFAGRGAGVQVMGVVDARGRTFGHLFLLGMNRGVFPRTVREDPLLADGLRKLLSAAGHGILPDLPVKSRGYVEERYLFAELLSSSPEVTLSRLEMDDADRSAPPSPLVERLRWCHPERGEDWRSPALVGRAPLLDIDPAGAPPARRLAQLPPRHHAVLAALEAPRRELREVWPLVVPAPAGVEPGSLVEARLAVLDELDPPGTAAAQSALSPYLGFVGAPGSGDPRANRQLYVTLVERMATCPWQTFIERVLRVEAVPDPLEALPRIDALLIGILVHAVLERVVGREPGAPPGDLAALAAATPRDVAWPSDPELGRLIDEEAQRTVRAAGIALRGFSRALAAVARPYLDTAQRLDWPAGRLPTLAAELHGELELELPGLAPRRLAFRADRADRRADGLVLTDYKTGAPPFPQKTAGSRYKRLLAAVASGRRLQPIVYALAAPGGRGFGRFAFLRPRLDAPEEARAIMVTSADAELRTAFERAAATTLRAWEQGLFFPRLEEPGEPHKSPPACRWCRVAEACLRLDSGARRRLRTGLERLAPGTPELSEELRRGLLEHWWLPVPGWRPGGAS